MPVFPEHKVVFIHIPKNMGTSVSKWLGLSNLDNAHLDLPHLFGQLQDRQLQHLKWPEITQYLDFQQLETYQVIAIVRNPSDRLISEYCWLSTHSFWSNRISQHLTSFSKFLDHLESLYDSGQLGQHFVHWHSQASFLESLDLMSPNVHLLVYDQAREQLGKLVQQLGLALDIDGLECLNQSNTKPTLTVQDLERLDGVVNHIYPQDLALYRQLTSAHGEKRLKF